MSGFVGLTHEHCAIGRIMIDPSITWGMSGGIFKRAAGHLVVLDPRLPYEPKYRSFRDDNFLDEVVLYQYSWGDPTTWEAPFGWVALSKAYASWKTGLPSREIQQMHPYLYEEGWTKYGGSVVLPGGLVVAFSGIQPWFDEMISGWMAYAIQGLCLDAMHRPNDGVMANEGLIFLGEES